MLLLERREWRCIRMPVCLCNFYARTIAAQVAPRYNI